jgi:hypothetical protein
LVDIFLRKAKIAAMILGDDILDPETFRDGADRWRMTWFRRFLQPGRVLRARGKFFIWIRCNPLKSPDSTKEKQGNPR